MEFEPIKLHPCYKEYIWGGDVLKKNYNKLDAPSITAESWELAAHKDGNAIIECGQFIGKSLTDVFKQGKLEYLGTGCKAEELPIIVKMIDAKQDLSVQVHPSDDTAIKELGERGKTEMLYVVDCEPHSTIFYGLSREISKDEFVKRAKNGTICDVMNLVHVAKGDFFFVKPGTIHAIGRGVVIVEIQQNSNTTFRLYDYGRKDKFGEYRDIHIKRATEVVNLNPIIPAECKANCEVRTDEYVINEMFSCQYFRAFRFDVFKEINLVCDGFSFHHILCVDGEGTISTDQGCWKLLKGDSYFLPAAMGGYKVEGECRFILSRL